MGYQIDQSGKIEQTSQDTILALSNSSKYAVVLKAKDKRVLQKMFRSIKQPENYVYFVFAASLAYLMSEAKPSGKVIIDREYQGHEEAILDRLGVYLGKLKMDPELEAEFRLIGKHSPAHILGAQVATGKRGVNLVLSAWRISRLIFGKKKDRVSHKGPRTA